MELGSRETLFEIAAARDLPHAIVAGRSARLLGLQGFSKCTDHANRHLDVLAARVHAALSCFVNSSTMYCAYQSGQFSSRRPNSCSCLPCAASAREREL